MQRQENQTASSTCSVEETVVIHEIVAHSLLGDEAKTGDTPFRTLQGDMAFFLTPLDGEVSPRFCPLHKETGLLFSMQQLML